MWAATCPDAACIVTQEMHYAINADSDSNHKASKSCGSTSEGQNWAMLFGCTILDERRAHAAPRLAQLFEPSQSESMEALTLLQWLPLHTLDQYPIKALSYYSKRWQASKNKQMRIHKH